MHKVVIKGGHKNSAIPPTERESLARLPLSLHWLDPQATAEVTLHDTRDTVKTIQLLSWFLGKLFRGNPATL